ncbi:MAG: copper homeostasis protein CutC [Planctomycetes bacterium]|nr:copper homeostasis protein CutC [Planctomycetota bacterium]
MTRPLLEICVDSIAAARAACDGGADRLELCAALDLDGLTPDVTFVGEVRGQVAVPLMVMVRPRGGGFTYDASELTVMESQAHEMRAAGADGIVFGCVCADGGVDREATERLIDAARPLPVTFHRALDGVPDPFAALDVLLDLGVDRVLTSGGPGPAHHHRDALRQLVLRAGDLLAIMPGGGVRADNVVDTVRTSHALEVHSSAGLGSDPDPDRVAALIKALDTI